MPKLPRRAHPRPESSGMRLRNWRLPYLTSELLTRWRLHPRPICRKSCKRSSKLEKSIQTGRAKSGIIQRSKVISLLYTLTWESTNTNGARKPRSTTCPMNQRSLRLELFSKRLLSALKKLKKARMKPSVLGMKLKKLWLLSLT